MLRPSGWRACLELVGWMRRQRIMLVQTFFIECNIVGPWLARLAGVPVVIGSRRNLNEWMGPAIRQIQRLANLSADCIVANSQIAAQSIQGAERVPQRKLHVAYNGIDLAKFSNLNQLRAHGRRMLGLAEYEVLVGNISCMRGVKGIPAICGCGPDRDRHGPADAICGGGRRRGICSGGGTDSALRAGGSDPSGGPAGGCFALSGGNGHWRA